MGGNGKGLLGTSRLSDTVVRITVHASEDTAVFEVASGVAGMVPYIAYIPDMHICTLFGGT